MNKYACYTCHGLGVIQPIDELTLWLNEQTPEGIHFTIVGGIDPQIEQEMIVEKLRADVLAGCQIVFIGHSKGAMLAYYLADDNPGWSFALVVSVDPTCWGSNINAKEWALAPPNPGQWQAPRENVGRWMNFRSATYPGGGRLVNAGPHQNDFSLPTQDHMSIINSPTVRRNVLSAIRELP